MADAATQNRRGRRGMVIAIVLTAFAVAAGVLLVARRGGTAASQICTGSAVGVNRPAPELAGTSLEDGQPLRYRAGRVTVVNIWGSWCGPCRREAPVLTRVARARPDVVFLGVDVQDNDAAGRAFGREFGVPYPSFSDPGRELASRLGASATPSTFVLDREGRIRAQTFGAVDLDTLQCMIGQAMPQ